MELQKFYDELFKKNPKKWANKDRDKFTFEICQKHLNFIKVLDIGCGNAHTLKTFHELSPSKSEYFGLDLSAEAIKLAEENAPFAAFWNAKFEEFTTRHKFDLILNMGTIEHFLNLMPNMAKLKKLLRKGGIIYFEAPNNLSYSPGEEAFRQLKRGSRQMEWHLSKKSWEDLFNQTGLDIIARYRGQKKWYEFIWILKSGT